MRRLLLKGSAVAIVCILFTGIILSLYWQFVQGLKPCPYCQAIRIAYIVGLLGLLILWAKLGVDALLWAALGWAGLTSILCALPFVTHCVSCFKREGVPFIGPLSAYHLALIGAAGIALLASAGLLLPREDERRL